MGEASQISLACIRKHRTPKVFHATCCVKTQNSHMWKVDREMKKENKWDKQNTHEFDGIGNGRYLQRWEEKARGNERQALECKKGKKSKGKIRVSALWLLVMCFYSPQIRHTCAFSSVTWTITSRCLPSLYMKWTWMRMLTWAPPSSQSVLMMKMKVGEDQEQDIMAHRLEQYAHCRET